MFFFFFLEANLGQNVHFLSLLPYRARSPDLSSITITTSVRSPMDVCIFVELCSRALKFDLDSYFCWYSKINCTIKSFHLVRLGHNPGTYDSTCFIWMLFEICRRAFSSSELLVALLGCSRRGFHNLAIYCFTNGRGAINSSPQLHLRRAIALAFLKRQSLTQLLVPKSPKKLSMDGQALSHGMHRRTFCLHPNKVELFVLLFHWNSNRINMSPSTGCLHKIF